MPVETLVRLGLRCRVQIIIAKTEKLAKVNIKRKLDKAIASKLLSTVMTKIKQKLTTEDTENTEINPFSAKNGGNVGAIYYIARFFDRRRRAIDLQCLRAVINRPYKLLELCCNRHKTDLMQLPW